MRCKTLFKSILLLTIIASFACNKVDDGSYVRPLTIYEKVMGKWKISAIKQVDEIALAGGIKPNELDLLSKFTFNTFQITLNVDSTKDILPTTYLVEGTAPSLFSNSGYWDLDQPYARTDGKSVKLLLYSDEAKTILTDELIITAVPGTKAEFGFKLTRSDNSVPFLSYTYTFKTAK